MRNLFFLILATIMLQVSAVAQSQNRQKPLDINLINQNAGGVTSVNGQTGDVQIDIPDVSTKLDKGDYTGTASELKSTLENQLSTKVDKEAGKGLSTNDYANADKNKLLNLDAAAEQNVQADWNITDINSDAYIKNKPKYTVNNTNFDAENNVNVEGFVKGTGMPYQKVLEKEIWYEYDFTQPLDTIQAVSYINPNSFFYLKDTLCFSSWHTVYKISDDSVSVMYSNIDGKNGSVNDVFVFNDTLIAYVGSYLYQSPDWGATWTKKMETKWGDFSRANGKFFMSRYYGGYKMYVTEDFMNLTLCTGHNDAYNVSFDGYFYRMNSNDYHYKSKYGYHWDKEDDFRTYGFPKIDNFKGSLYYCSRKNLFKSDDFGWSWNVDYGNFNSSNYSSGTFLVLNGESYRYASKALYKYNVKTHASSFIKGGLQFPPTKKGDVIYSSTGYKKYISTTDMKNWQTCTEDEFNRFQKHKYLLKKKVGGTHEYILYKGVKREFEVIKYKSVLNEDFLFDIIAPMLEDVDELKRKN